MIGGVFLEFALLGAQWVLWLLAALSVLSIAVAIDRLRFYRRRVVDTEALASLAAEAIRSGKDSFETGDVPDDALELRVAEAGVAAAALGPGATGESMNRAKAHGRRDYERLLSILGTLGNNAPFIGLFGTVLGIVGAFDKLKDNPEGGIDVVGGDLSEALVATAVGILVAVPAVIAFNYFNRRLKTSLLQADEIAHAVLAAVHERGIEK